LASGKPIIANNYTDIINDNEIGYSHFFKTAEEYAEAIESFVNLNKEKIEEIKQNSLKTIKLYDCKELCKEIINVSKNI